MKPFNRRRTFGRTAPRSGATVQGQLATWTQSVVSQYIAERDRSRVNDRAVDLYSNDAMSHGMIESLVVEAVGVGLTPQFAPDHVGLGQSQDWADAYISTLSRTWSRWGLDCRMWADAQRRLSIYGLQQVMYFSWRLAGIGLAQVVEIKTPAMRPSPIAVLPLDPSRLVTPSDAQGLDIYDGIEIDQYGAPLRAWLVRPEHMSPTAMSYSKAQCQPVDIWDQTTGLPRLLLVTGVRNIAEYRQDSILSPMIEEIRINRDLVGASLVNAMIRNLFVMFLQNSAGRIDKDAPLEERMVQSQFGTVLQGTANEIPHFFDHKASPDGYREMFDSIVDRLGMATTRGAENVSRKYQASYSASKASMVKSEQVNAVEHMTLVDRFCQPLLMWLTYEQALAGNLPVPSTDTLVADLYDLTVCEWLPQPMPEIDRAKRANAIQTELETGQTTYADIYGGQSKDWRKQMRQRAIEKKYLADLEAEFGVSLQPTPAAPAMETGGRPDPDDEGSDLETA